MLNAALLDELRQAAGADGLQVEPAELVAYSFDGTFQQHIPDAVVSPHTTEEVAAVLRIAHEARISIVPRGAGTSLSGGTIPIEGGIVLNLARMDRIIEVDAANVVAVVEAGVVNASLQRAAEAVGLFYPPDPASLQQCTLGGNVACNAGGPRCLKYGVTKDYVLGMTVVLADGRVLRLGGKLLKNVTGYQLMQLFVGSEGTLGVITELTLRLLPAPRARCTATAAFPTIEGASQAVATIMGSGILPAALELMDGTSIRMVEAYLGLGLPQDAEALLILEQDGSETAVAQREVERMAAICRELGAQQVQVAADDQEREALWRARRAVSPALGRARPQKFGEDIAVPPSQIPALVRRIREIEAEFGLPIPVFGHAGDGNLHPNVLFDRAQPGELERVEGAAKALFRAALALGGTLSGEHGIGTLKREFLEEDLGPDAVAVMRSIKAVLDPKGILNPGKMFPQGNTDTFLTTLPMLQGLTPG